LRPIKALGQHFLKEPAIAEEMVKLAEINANDRVWEIGPGKGILTRALIATGCNIKAFELDQRLESLLKNEFGDRIELKIVDVLQMDWESELKKESVPVKLVANIPYNITSPLLEKLEEYQPYFTSATLMVQEEVAERICAVPGNKAYGLMTLRLQRLFDSYFLIKVPREYFEPVPKVNSAVVSLRPRAKPADIPDLNKYLTVLETAFCHRRKTLRNNLLHLTNRDRLAQIQSETGIDLNRRGETLSEAEFITISRYL
jgi:16S rRNA (adenine1518-N6/adenine1519-N6)-dimethyltransferase